MLNIIFNALAGVAFVYLSETSSFHEHIGDVGPVPESENLFRSN
jgi:hypothetical protein